jgi:hypothetical protein
MPENVYDQASRYALKELYPPGVWPWLLTEKIRSNWEWRGWLDTRTVPFPGEPERICDTVALFERTTSPAPPVALVAESQSRPEGEVLERVLEYLLRLRREKPFQRHPLVRYQTVGMVLNLTGPAQLDTLEITPEDFEEDFALRFKIEMRSLREEDGPALLQAIASGQHHRCLLVWIPLMQGGDQPELIAQWRQLAESEPDSRLRADYGGLARIFAELADRSPLWNQGLEGYNVETSQVVQEWMQQGEAKGRQMLQAKLLQVLRARFAVEPPQEIVQAVAAQHDLDVLGRWFDLVLTADSVEQVRTGILSA